MVFFNYTTMQASAKIVYYGPGLCGKTTNLQYIHAKTDPSSRGEMVSLETEADRTLFFDLLPLEVGTIGGMRVRLQLYTVPGQVFYNTTRKLVLKGVDGIVFVADSQVPALDANLESLNNLRHNLEELNQPLEKLPFVLQYNKRDLRNIHSVEVLDRYINRKGHDVYEAAALHGVGVFETLKAISKKTLAAVHRRIAGEDGRPERPAPHLRVPSTGVSSGLFPKPRSTTPPSLTLPASSRAGEAPLAAKPGTAEVKVEFAASPTPTPPVRPERVPHRVRTIATKSRFDIERELEELRRIAWGKKPPTAVGKAPPIEVVHKGDYESGIRVKLPRNVLEKASHLIMELKIGSKTTAHRIVDPLRFELPPRSEKRGKQLIVTFELEEDDNG